MKDHQKSVHNTHFLVAAMDLTEPLVAPWKQLEKLKKNQARQNEDEVRNRAKISSDTIIKMVIK
jgi:hypothetical protein